MTYGIGTLAYYDAIQSGLVPCKVIAVHETPTGTEVSAVVTGARYAYPKGYVIVSSPTWIVPRTHVKVRSNGSTILGGYQYVNAHA